MKANTASRTAQYMALFRAVETNCFKHTKLFNDPYAIHFLDKKLQRAVQISALPVIGRLIPFIIHKKGIGAISSGIARTRYIDDLLLQTIHDGVKQVIILGAGFDTRALRLDFLQDVVVTEIDHPDTSTYKTEVLKKTLKNLPYNVSFQKADFNAQTLHEVAAAAQIDFSVPTTVIWEGVTNYLSREAVANTFGFTKQFASPFHIIFTYVDKDVLVHPEHFKGTAKLFTHLNSNEEQWTFGLYPGELSAYLQQYNLTVTEDKNATAYREMYMPERKYLLEGYEFYRVAIAIK